MKKTTNLSYALSICAIEHKLSATELKIISFIANGVSLTEVSPITQRSIKTLSTHKRSAYVKIGVESDVGFIHYLYAINFILNEESPST